MIKIIIIAIAILVLFVSYCLCYIAKCADIELEKLREIEEKMKDKEL